MRFSAEACNAYGAKIAYRNYEVKPLSDRAFVAFYGRTPEEVSELWDLCSPHINKPKIRHLFWTLMFMKLYISQDVLCVMLDTTLPTLQKWTWVWIEAIAMRHHDVIRWEKRLRNLPKDAWCSITVDGTDFQIGEPVPFDKRWKSPKNNGASVKYEVAISIYSGDIVWIYGPHNGGKHDYRILKEKLKEKLGEEEMVEADAGYGYHGVAYVSDNCVRSRDDFQSEQEKREKSELRARHETCNRRFKTWGILKQAFRNNKKKHQFAFYAVAVMTQMSIDNGDVLFACEPTSMEKPKMYRI